MNVSWQAYTFPFHLFDIFDVRLLHVWSLAGRESKREQGRERKQAQVPEGPKDRRTLEANFVYSHLFFYERVILGIHPAHFLKSSVYSCNYYLYIG